MGIEDQETVTSPGALLHVLPGRHVRKRRRGWVWPLAWGLAIMAVIPLFYAGTLIGQLLPHPGAQISPAPSARPAVSSSRPRKPRHHHHGPGSSPAAAVPVAPAQHAPGQPAPAPDPVSSSAAAVPSSRAPVPSTPAPVPSSPVPVPSTPAPSPTVSASTPGPAPSPTLDLTPTAQPEAGGIT